VIRTGGVILYVRSIEISSGESPGISGHHGIATTYSVSSSGGTLLWTTRSRNNQTAGEQRYSLQARGLSQKLTGSPIEGDVQRSENANDDMEREEDIRHRKHQTIIGKRMRTIH